MKSVICLGVDPGIANTGICVVQHDGTSPRVLSLGCVKTDASQNTGRRLETINAVIAGTLERFSPDGMAVELVFHNKNIGSSISTGKVIGICELLACEYDVKCYMGLMPQQVKNASGLGAGATKKDMLKMAQRVFKTEFKNHHIADAAFCGLAGCLSLRSQN